MLKKIWIFKNMIVELRGLFENVTVRIRIFENMTVRNKYYRQEQIIKKE